MICRDDAAARSRDVFQTCKRDFCAHFLETGMDKIVVAQVPIEFNKPIDFIFVDNPFQVIDNKSG